MRRDWLLVGSNIRLRAGVLSHWLRGRQRTMAAEAFQSRWCHEEVLCSRPAEVTDQLLLAGCVRAEVWGHQGYPGLSMP